MRKIIILAAAAAGIAGLTGTAFAHGGGPAGSHYWQSQTPAYQQAHPADYACQKGNVLIVQPQPCANGQLG